MTRSIKLYNPSSYPRKGNVILPWQDVFNSVKLKKGEFVVRDKANNELPYQIDIIDPEDNSKDLLVIGIANEIPEGPDNYSYASSSINIEKHKSKIASLPPGSLKLEIKNDDKGVVRGILFSNERLKVFINLLPKIDYNWQKWYAGAATSVVLDGEEIMDISDWLHHDEEKRCMQIDKITIPNSPWEENSEQDIFIYDKPYRVVSVNDKGPNRISASIETDPIDYVCTNPSNNSQIHLKISLFRVISLDRYSDHIKENIFIKAREKNTKKRNSNISIRFKARYFSYINIGHDVDTYYASNVPDWLAIGNKKFPPFCGYGFATDVHNESFVNPHPTFPNSNNAYKSYSWLTGAGKEINCIHHFSRGEYVKFDDKSGHYWYEKIYKPLRAVWE